MRRTSWFAVCRLAALICTVLFFAAKTPGQKTPYDDRADLPSGAVAAAQQVAATVDLMLADELWSDTDARPASRVDDYGFLRRASLDLTGHLPTVEEIEVFASSDEPQRRLEEIQRLLDDSRYGENWARYWRDVIMFRRTEERAVQSAGAVVEYLTESLNENRPWDRIARDFTTAEGDVREQGETAIIMAHAGRPEETVAELSRIFLGIQIQCAQCHDHPTDRWSREQFHELAAFYPRTFVQRRRTDGKRTFVVSSRDRPTRRRPNNDRHVGETEHYMPDLDDPAAQGTLMEPVFFVSGESLELGTRDADRRAALAAWITDDSNEWFAKSLVNRMWSELVGVGFYEPVDDIGPDRDAVAPETLDYLAASFVESGYDLKWLLATIMSTEAYQRRSRSRDPSGEVAFLSSHPQRLRSDQLFNALVSVLTFNDARAANRMGAGNRGRGPRTLFGNVFGYDPSEPRDQITGSVPQALLLMNGEIVQRLGARRARALAAQLRNRTDEEIVEMLYLTALSRPPKRKELATALQYADGANNRVEALEDLLWVLINSAEFIHRG